MKFPLIDFIPIDEASATPQEVQQEQQPGQDDLMRALETVNNIFDRHPEILAYYWYLWMFRDRIELALIPTDQVTRRMIKQMTIETDE